MITFHSTQVDYGLVHGFQMDGPARPTLKKKQWKLTISSLLPMIKSLSARLSHIQTLVGRLELMLALWRENCAIQ